MKKLVLVLAILFTSISVVNAYSLTEKDTLIVTRATTIIEKQIQKKWENARMNILSQLGAFRDKNYANNERMHAILNKVIDSLSPLPEIDTSGWWSVICTELTRQGYLPKEVWYADEAYAKKYISQGTLDVYHFWANPIVSMMKKSNFITFIVSPYGKAWANHMAYEMGVIQEDNWLGKHLLNILLPVHQKISSLFVANINWEKHTRASVVSPSFIEVVEISILYWLLFVLIIFPVILFCLGIFLLVSFFKKWLIRITNKFKNTTKFELKVTS